MYVSVHAHVLERDTHRGTGSISPLMQMEDRQAGSAQVSHST